MQQLSCLSRDRSRASGRDAGHSSTLPGPSHHLRFASLFDPDRALSFPCDCGGEVQLDDLSERARNNYFFARACVGRDYGHPTVVAVESGSAH
jgi:hypothetical protein